MEMKVNITKSFMIRIMSTTSDRKPWVILASYLVPSISFTVPKNIKWFKFFVEVYENFYNRMPFEF